MHLFAQHVSSQEISEPESSIVSTDETNKIIEEISSNEISQDIFQSESGIELNPSTNEITQENEIPKNEAKIKTIIIV